MKEVTGHRPANSHSFRVRLKQLPYPISALRVRNITKFYTVVKSPQKRRWQWCYMTITCSMRQSNSNHCNSWGYDLISLAAVVWHHTAALRCRAAALRCHSSSETATRDLKMLQRLWNCHIVLLHELCDCRTAVHQTENFRRKRRALCANCDIC